MILLIEPNHGTFDDQTPAWVGENDPMQLPDFAADRHGLDRAVELLTAADAARRQISFNETVPDQSLPEIGVGSIAALELLAPHVLEHSRDLGAPGFFAHMDPPTPWITWATHMWTASQNQNLLHPDTSPVARSMEQRVVDWLAPFFGMSGGHMTPGSTVANLTAIWAAREAGARDVVASPGTHISVKKAAHLLGLPFRTVDDWTRSGQVDSSVVVITAGTTSTGHIETLDAAPDAHWRHIDAAWAGPLRLSNQHRHLLDGIEQADSVAVSAHKWLFQPKESALVLFADHESAHASISVDGAYLAAPNVGLLGSHGATATPLLATLLAFGRSGIADLLDSSMLLAQQLFDLVEAAEGFVTRSAPQTGVVCWRHESVPSDALQQRLPPDVFISTTVIDDVRWLRSVAANPLADPELVVAAAQTAAQTLI